MEKHKIQFRVKDKVLGEDLTLENISLSIFSEFSIQVASFVRGSNKVDLSEIKTSLKNGSIAIEFENQNGFLDDVFSDYELTRTAGLVDDIDPRRIKVVEQWQAMAKKNENREYELSLIDEVKNTIEGVIKITKNSNFALKQTKWVDVEEYLYGKIFDLGGKSKPNVHLELDDGRTVKIGSEASLLTRDNENRLYQKQLIRLSGQKNLITSELRNEKLISFENYAPSFEEKSFEAIVQQGRQAWKTIANPTEWLESLRGNE